MDALFDALVVQGFCRGIIDEFNMGYNVVITEENKKESFKKIIDIINLSKP